MLGMVRGRSGQLGTGCESEQDEVELWNQMNVAGCWQLEHNTTTRVEGMIKDSLHVLQGVDCMQTGTTDMWEQNVYEVGRFLLTIGSWLHIRFMGYAAWKVTRFGTAWCSKPMVPGLCIQEQPVAPSYAGHKPFFFGETNQPWTRWQWTNPPFVDVLLYMYLLMMMMMMMMMIYEYLWNTLHNYTQLYAYICLSLAALEVSPTDWAIKPQVVKMILKIDDVITSGDVIDEWALPHARNIGNMKEHSRTLKQNSTSGSNFGTLYCIIFNHPTFGATATTQLLWQAPGI